MGREVKRVDLKFNWFEKTKDEKDWRKKIWFGYLLNIATPCQLCEEGKIGKDNCPLCYGEKYVQLDVEPPEGDGWQMWENVSEGCPISPVFKTPEKLARWLADSGASAMGSQTATYEQWLKMIKVGFAPSGVMIGGKMMTGVEAAGK